MIDWQNKYEQGKTLSHFQEKLCEPKQCGPVDPTRVHEVAAAVHQLPHEERRSLRWQVVNGHPISKPFYQKIDFRLCSDLGCDDRAFHMSTVSSMDVASSLVYFYPRLIPLHTVNPEETGVPEQIR